MEKYLEYKDDKSHKFWEIEVLENEFTVVYGKFGTNGQSKTKHFDDAEMALKEANKLVAQKIKKGYVEFQKNEDETIKSNANKNTEKETPIKNLDYFGELVKFDKKYGSESYAQSFWIIDDEDDFFESWLDISQEQIQEYGQSMKVFASADGTGARYAFWYTGGNKDPNKAPIVYYGSEGEIAMLACDIQDLIKMLSFGQECMDGSFYFGMYDKEDFETEEEFFEDELKYRPNFRTFRSWMKDTLNIEPVKNWKIEDNKEVNKLIKKAKKKYKKSFDKWQYQFYPDPNDEMTIYHAEQKEIYITKKAELLKKVAAKPTVDLYLQLAKNETIPKEVDFKQKGEYHELALKLEPNHIEALEEYVKNCRFDSPRAIETYKKLIKIHPEPQKYYSNLAFSLMQSESEEDNAKSIEWYTKAILAEPNSYGEYYQGYILSTAKKLKLDGVEILENILTKVDDRACCLLLYKHYFKKKKYTKAKDYALKYFDLSDEQSHNYEDIAVKFYDKNALDEAAQLFEKILTEKKDHFINELGVTNYIGLCYLDTDYDKALKYFHICYKLNKKEVAIHQNLHVIGRRFYHAKEYDKAKEVFEFCINNFKYKKKDSENFLALIKKES